MNLSVEIWLCVQLKMIKLNNLVNNGKAYIISFTTTSLLNSYLAEQFL